MGATDIKPYHIVKISKNRSKIPSQRGTQPPRRGLPLRTGQRGGTMCIPTVRNDQGVLEFVAVGGSL